MPTAISKLNELFKTEFTTKVYDNSTYVNLSELWFQGCKRRYIRYTYSDALEFLESNLEKYPTHLKARLDGNVVVIYAQFKYIACKPMQVAAINACRVALKRRHPGWHLDLPKHIWIRATHALYIIETLLEEELLVKSKAA